VRNDGRATYEIELGSDSARMAEVPLMRHTFTAGVPEAPEAIEETAAFPRAFHGSEQAT